LNILRIRVKTGVVGKTALAVDAMIEHVPFQHLYELGLCMVLIICHHV
jgi:hypothetical protein